MADTSRFLVVLQSFEKVVGSAPRFAYSTTSLALVRRENYDTVLRLLKSNILFSLYANGEVFAYRNRQIEPASDAFRLWMESITKQGVDGVSQLTAATVHVVLSFIQVRSREEMDEVVAKYTEENGTFAPSLAFYENAATRSGSEKKLAECQAGLAFGLSVGKDALRVIEAEQREIEAKQREIDTLRYELQELRGASVSTLASLSPSVLARERSAVRSVIDDADRIVEDANRKLEEDKQREIDVLRYELQESRGASPGTLRSLSPSILAQERSKQRAQTAFGAAPPLPLSPRQAGAAPLASLAPLSPRRMSFR